MSKRPYLSSRYCSGLAAYLISFSLVPSSVYALSDDACYSLQLVSVYNKNASKVNLQHYPKECEFISFEKTKAIRCGCTRDFQEITAKKEDYSNAYPKAQIVNTLRKRFSQVATASVVLVAKREKEEVSEAQTIDEVSPAVLRSKEEAVKTSKETQNEIIMPIVLAEENLAINEDFSTNDSYGDVEELEGFDEEDNELDGFSDEEDELAGFSDDEDEVLSITQAEEDKGYSLSGDITFKMSAGYKKHEVDGIEYSGINQAQTSMYLQFDTKLNDNWKLRVSGDAFYDAIYDIRSSNDYRDSILDEYRTQLRLDDTYVQGRLSDDVDLKAGRQIVVWGKSDNIRVTDVINPTDNRLPGMTDIEDIRLPVGMLKFDYYISDWDISAMIIPESRTFIEAPARSEFFPVDVIFRGAPDPFPTLDTPSSSVDNMQYALAANGAFSGWDLSFYASHVLDSRWHFKVPVRRNRPLSERTVNRVNMLGSAFNMVSGSWLFKSEAAFFNGIRYSTTGDEKNRLDFLLGLEYMGFRDTVLSAEVVNRHIFSYEFQMALQPDFVDKNELQTALRASKTFENETIEVGALLNMYGQSWEKGGFMRMWLEYDIMDAVSTSFGFVNYLGGDRPTFEGIKDNDRIFADLTYSF